MGFNKDMTIEQIIKEMDASGRQEVTLAVGQAYLQLALHQESLDSQNEFQKGQLKRTTLLVIATWIMAIANVILVLFNLR
jgi:hypothetical protein